MKCKFTVLALLAALACAACTAPVRLAVLAPDIVRVTASPDDDFERAPSLMRNGTLPGAEFEVEEDEDAVTLHAARVSARVALDTGAVSFHDPAGNELLAERPARDFTAADLGGATRYAVRQQFDAGPGDAFYGLGQHQNGQFNYRGENVELAQHNISIAVPFLASTGGYGILWDNNSITRFGDARPFAPLDDALVVRGPDGSEGGFEGRYYSGDSVALTLREADPDYEFLEPDQYLDDDGERDVWPEPFVADAPDRGGRRRSLAPELESVLLPVREGDAARRAPRRGNRMAPE
ncbi:MAG: DUF4968 domain-containing protein [Woeseiaceae bacterium]